MASHNDIFLVYMKEFLFMLNILKSINSALLLLSDEMRNS